MTIIERIIIESLGEKSKSLPELLQDTGLTKQILIGALHFLLKSKTVEEKAAKLQLNPKTIPQFIADQKHEIKEEIKELMAVAVDQHFDDQSDHISLKKVWMTKSDEVVFKMHLANMEQFLNGLKEDNLKAKRPLWEKKVFYWGITNYKKALDSQLQLL